MSRKKWVNSEGGIVTCAVGLRIAKIMAEQKGCLVQAGNNLALRLKYSSEAIAS